MENLILDRITIIPDFCNDKLTARGMRITVETILQYLSAGDSATDIRNLSFFGGLRYLSSF